MKLDIDYLDGDYSIEINGEPYTGDIVVGDVLTVNGIDYRVQGINEDAVVVKKL